MDPPRGAETELMRVHVTQRRMKAALFRATDTSTYHTLHDSTHRKLKPRETVFRRDVTH